MGSYYLGIHYNPKDGYVNHMQILIVREEYLRYIVRNKIAIGYTVLILLYSMRSTDNISKNKSMYIFSKTLQI